MSRLRERRATFPVRQCVNHYTLEKLRLLHYPIIDHFKAYLINTLKSSTKA